MTNTPTTPQHILEQWRADFLAVFKILNPNTSMATDKNGNYVVQKAHDAWFIFQAARRTTCIKLPWAKVTQAGLGTNAERFANQHNNTLAIVQKSIEQQGYQCRVKDE